MSPREYGATVARVGAKGKHGLGHNGSQPRACARSVLSESHPGGYRNPVSGVSERGFPRKGGRVVDCSGLENRRCESIRGFESHPFRQ